MCRVWSNPSLLHVLFIDSTTTALRRIDASAYVARFDQMPSWEFWPTGILPHRLGWQGLTREVDFNREIPCKVNRNRVSRSLGIQFHPLQDDDWLKKHVYTHIERERERVRILISLSLSLNVLYAFSEVKPSEKKFRCLGSVLPSKESCIHPVANFKKNDRGCVGIWHLSSGWDLLYLALWGNPLGTGTTGQTSLHEVNVVEQRQLQILYCCRRSRPGCSHFHLWMVSLFFVDKLWTGFYASVGHIGRKYHWLQYHELAERFHWQLYWQDLLGGKCPWKERFWWK